MIINQASNREQVRELVRVLGKRDFLGACLLASAPAGIPSRIARGYVGCTARDEQKVNSAVELLTKIVSDLDRDGRPGWELVSRWSMQPQVKTTIRRAS